MIPRLRVTREIPIDILRWAGSSELVSVETPFHRQFVDGLKVVCDGMVCRWMKDEKVWMVHPVSLPDVVDLCMRTWGRVDMDAETERMFCDVTEMLNMGLGSEL